MSRQLPGSTPGESRGSAGGAAGEPAEGLAPPRRGAGKGARRRPRSPCGRPAGEPRFGERSHERPALPLSPTAESSRGANRRPLTLRPVHHLLRAPLGHRLHGGLDLAKQAPSPAGHRSRTPPDADPSPVSGSHPGRAARGRPLLGLTPPAGPGWARPAAAPPPGAVPRRAGPAVNGCGRPGPGLCWLLNSSYLSGFARPPPPDLQPVK